MLPSEFLTPPEVARLLRIRQSKILSWIRSGRLPALNLSEGQRPRYRVRRVDLDHYLESKAVAPANKPARRRSADIPSYV